jgi:hypothetical protein
VLLVRRSLSEHQKICKTSFSSAQLGSIINNRIIQEDVKLFPYRIQMQQALVKANKARRVDFCSNFKIFFEYNAAVLQSIWFSDEAHFHLNGYVNRQNMLLWASQHLHNIMETPLHPQKCTVWCTLSTSGGVGPMFFDDTVTADCYLHVLQEEFFLFLQGMGVTFRETFFQQDGARPHCECSVGCAQ